MDRSQQIEQVLPGFAGQGEADSGRTQRQILRRILQVRLEMSFFHVWYSV